MVTPSRLVPWTRKLDDEDAKVGRALAGGHIPSVAKAAMDHRGLREAILQLVLNKIGAECTTLCKRSPPSLFRKIAVEELMEFRWEKLIADLCTKAPLLLQILSSIVSTNDHRNRQKAGAAHYPGICMAIAVILKERNREMCGVQSLISLLLFSAHAEKKVYLSHSLPMLSSNILSIYTY